MFWCWVLRLSIGAGEGAGIIWSLIMRSGLEKVIYRQAIAVRHCTAELRCAEGIICEYYCDERYDQEYSCVNHIVVLLSFEDA